jgi:WhiB family transcriptional regulator, redox-sensing transcriptional regulator
MTACPKKPAFATFEADYIAPKTDLPAVAVLLDMIDQGLSRADIAAEYGRSTSALNMKINTAGYPGYKPGDRAKTAEPHVDVIRFIRPDWTEDALCAQTDPEAFYPEKGGSTREAKRICMSCDVREPCLDAAIERDERFGIWGGLSERERRKIKRQRSIPTTPVQVPAPAAASPTIVKEAPAMEQPTPAAYVEQIIAVMAATEGHPDPAVRAARKVVANALVALNKTFLGSGKAVSPGLVVVPRPAASKRGGSRAQSDRIAALGTTSRGIREWAASRGIDVPARGVLSSDVIDSYERAHRQAAS